MASSHPNQNRGSTPDVVARVLDDNIALSEFELQSRYYVHFRSDTLGERYESP